MSSTVETTSALRPLGDELSSRLGHFGQLVRRHLLVAGAARVVAQAALIVLVCFWLDKWFRLGRPARFVLLLAAVAWLVRETWQHVARPMRARFGLVDLAAAVDRAAGEGNGSSLAPRVATVLELPDLLRTSTPPSPAMVERAVHHAADTLRGVDFTLRLDERRYKLNLGSIGAIALVLLLLVTMNHALAGLWLRRWFAGSNEPWPQRTYLQIAGLVDGRLIVPRGEPFLLRVGVRHGALAPENVDLVLREKGASRINASMTRFGPGDFRYDVPPVQQPITIEAEGGDDDFGPFVIDPVDRPRMANLALLSQHPTESQPTTHTFAGQEADFSFLPKTKLELTFGANVPVAEAIVKGPTTAPSVTELRRIDDRHFAIAWTHDKPVQLQIEFVGKEAKLSSLPTPVTIGLKTDQPPRVTLSYTGVRQRITPNATIPLTVVARDD